MMMRRPGRISVLLVLALMAGALDAYSQDTRTQEETSNTSAVLDGDIDRFINAYLKMEAGKAERENI